MTPIVYPASIVPEHYRVFLELNPMTPLVQLYQNALLYDQWPPLSALAGPALLAAVMILFAFAFFRRASPELVDAL